MTNNKQFVKLKTEIMQKITTLQLKKIHVLINHLQLQDDKEYLIKEASNNRTTSSKELTMHEARWLISALCKHDPNDKMRKKIFAIAYEIGIIYGDTPEDKKINVAKLNMFLLEKGTVKKEIRKMNRAELVKTVSQFDQIKKHKDQSHAIKSTASLLTELNIQSSFTRQTKVV